MVVTVPVRDEAANLPRLLATTLLWADHVVIADQGSSDGSAELARSFPGVTVVDNPSRSYGEDARQQILLDAARKLTPAPRLLVALDADEIMSANVLESEEWDEVLRALPGTSIRLARVELAADTTRYLRHWWDDAGVRGGFAYMDDGAAHTGRRLHSNRLPEPPAPRLSLEDVVVLHYSQASPRRVASRERWYQCFERVHFPDQYGDVAIRRRYDWLKRAGPDVRMRSCPAAWTGAYARAGIDLVQPAEDRYFWTDWDVLRMFDCHSTSTFRFLDIWNFDWEAARGEAVARGIAGVPPRPIVPPGDVVSRSVRRFLDLSARTRWRVYTDAAVSKGLAVVTRSRNGHR